jgi:hypothetical protein
MITGEFLKVKHREEFYGPRGSSPVHNPAENRILADFDTPPIK